MIVIAINNSMSVIPKTGTRRRLRHARYRTTRRASCDRLNGTWIVPSVAEALLRGEGCRTIRQALVLLSASLNGNVLMSTRMRPRLRARVISAPNVAP